MKKIYLLTFVQLLLCSGVIAQISGRRTISGFVKESQSSETLIGVYVFLPDLKVGTVTNAYGFYSITIPTMDSVRILFSYVGYLNVERKVSAKTNQELNIFLESSVNKIEAVVVTAEGSEKPSETVKMSTIDLPVIQMKNVPSLLGEKDVFKVLQLMPGVQKGNEGSSGLYVRGGGPDQNLIILDDANVYNASHLFGFFSLFNGDALKSIELTKGGFPARYGGRLSSVLEMNMKEGNKEKWHGDGGVGIVSSRLTIEGPLVKDKSSILISGRRTYIDLLIRPFMKSDNYGGYYFYDLNGKVNYDFGRKNKIYLSGYFGKDKFYFNNDAGGNVDDAGIYWGNSTGTFRWNHLFTDQIFANTSVIYSNYKFTIYAKSKSAEDNQDYYLNYYSGIRDWTIKSDFDLLPNPNHWIKAGLISTYHKFTPYALEERNIPVQFFENDVQDVNTFESGIYIEDTWKPLDRLSMNGGLRYSFFYANNKYYSYPEPRLSAAWKLDNNMALKASYANMNQYIHLLTNTGISLPTDLWVPTTDKIGPQQSMQVAAGFVKDILKPAVSFSIEGYYKKLNHVIGYKEGASFLNIGDSKNSREFSWEDNITKGKGWSYGAEIFIQKKAGNFSGWLGYTLSWTQLQFDSLNFGKKFYARYDRRHDISLVGIYQIDKNITISATWVYGTGNAITLPVSDYGAESHYPETLNGGVSIGYPFDNSTKVREYGEKNGFRMAPYHRLDIGIQFHKNTSWGQRTWEISFYNVYNRKNPFFYYPSDNDNGENTLYQMSLFPIIPSISYSFKF